MTAVVDVRAGTVRGDEVDADGVYAFKCVPFAAPPTGSTDSGPPARRALARRARRA